MGGEAAQGTGFALSDDLTVHGFGSFFTGALNPNDIDLLILHKSIELESCRFAINCKRRLEAELPEAHIVMLSQAESAGNSFLQRAGAVQLCSVREDNLEADVQALMLNVRIRWGRSRGILG
jgi:hypothetical protein